MEDNNQNTQNNNLRADNSEYDTLSYTNTDDMTGMNGMDNIDRLKIPSVTPGTIIRTVWLGIAIINYILALFNLSPLQVDNEFVTDAVNLGFLVVPAIWSWWKNNSFTKGALISDMMIKPFNSMVEEGTDLIVDIETRPDPEASGTIVQVNTDNTGYSNYNGE